jgi:hypothetical protein
MKFIIRTYLFLFLVLSITSCTEKNKSNQQTQTNQSPDNKKIDVVQPEDVVTPPNLPPLGKWMYTSEKKYSDWLGEKLNGKTLREPVNIVIVDSISKSADDAKNLLIKNFKLAGFEIRSGHSGGYLGFIEKMLYTQLRKNIRSVFNKRSLLFYRCVQQGKSSCKYSSTSICIF